MQTRTAKSSQARAVASGATYGSNAVATVTNTKKRILTMVKKLLKKLSAALMLAALFGIAPATAQERLYIEGPELTPGDATVKLLTISFENAAYEDYCAFQFDIELPKRP